MVVIGELVTMAKTATLSVVLNRSTLGRDEDLVSLGRTQ